MSKKKIIPIKPLDIINIR